MGERVAGIVALVGAVSVKIQTIELVAELIKKCKQNDSESKDHDKII